MKTFNEIAAQGELRIRRIGDVPSDLAVPAGFKAIAPENGLYVVGHSETGHHHVFDADDNVLVREKIDVPAGMKILHAILIDTKELRHLRGFDTHEAIQHQPGMYEISAGREFDPYAELARSVQD